MEQVQPQRTKPSFSIDFASSRLPENFDVFVEEICCRIESFYDDRTGIWLRIVDSTESPQKMSELGGCIEPSDFVDRRKLLVDDENHLDLFELFEFRERRLI